MAKKENVKETAHWIGDNEFIKDTAEFLTGLFLGIKDIDDVAVLLETVEMGGNDDHLRLAVSLKGVHLYTSHFYPREVLSLMFGVTSDIITGQLGFTPDNEGMEVYSSLLKSLLDFVGNGRTLLEASPPFALVATQMMIVEKMFTELYDLWDNVLKFKDEVLEEGLNDPSN